MTEKKYKIERTTDKGYESEEYDTTKALEILNTELENKRTVFIDGRPFSGEVIREENILSCKKVISVTNSLIGG